MRRAATALLALPIAAAGLALFAFAEARGDPVMRTAAIAIRGWPAGAAPVRVALISDVHLGNLSTDTARVARLVAAVDAARPDLVLLAGDYVDASKRGEIAPAAAILGRLHAPLGVVAVLGNHDHYADAAATTRALGRAGITVLINAAVRRGPLVIGGLDDGYTLHARPAEMLAAMRSLTGARLVVSHTPDPAATLPPGLVLAGHTHCGQIVPPFIDPPVTISRYGRRFACGLIREGGRVVVVTAGIGTSELPLRFGAPPDWWLLTLGPPQISRAPARPR